jgi:hypothetical protein
MRNTVSQRRVTALAAAGPCCGASLIPVPLAAHHRRAKIVDEA